MSDAREPTASTGVGGGPASGRRSGIRQRVRGILRRRVPIVVTCLVLTATATAVGGATLVRSPHLAGAESVGDGRDDSTAYPQRLTQADPAMSVAPLRRIIPPDVLALADGPIDGTTLKKISEIKDVREVVSFDGGSVRLHGQPLDVFGVKPSTFRGWTPPPTASADNLWRALAHDRFVTSFDAGRERGLELGGTYQIEGRGSPRVRLGAVATLGLPGVDALVNERTSERLGLVRNLGVLVNAPGTDMRKLTKALRVLLGEKAQILSLREHDAGPPPTTSSPRGQATSYLDLYRQAAAGCSGLSWTILAAIGQIESGHGRNNGPSTAGALGPMQFLPSTWAAYGIDGDGDGRAEIMNPYDAVPSAAGYLCANGAGRGGDSLANAIWHYNHAGWYVQDVLSLARAYSRTYG